MSAAAWEDAFTACSASSRPNAAASSTSFCATNPRNLLAAADDSIEVDASVRICSSCRVSSSTREASAAALSSGGLTAPSLSFGGGEGVPLSAGGVAVLPRVLM